MPTLVCVAGDVMLDVLVSTTVPLVPDDDVPAQIAMSAGGQGANVAAWVTHLGGAARLYGPCAQDIGGRYVRGELAARGVDVRGPAGLQRTGAVLSLVSDGRRTLASDAVDPAWIDEALGESRWLSGARWLQLSGYVLLRAARLDVLTQTADAARGFGAGVGIDLACAAMIQQYGSGAFADLVRSLRPAVVFGTSAEWDALEVDPAALATNGCDCVVKSGAAGIAVLRGRSHPAREYVQACEVKTYDVKTYDVLPGPVVDVTGAGDALAAGYLLGGPERAMRAAAECVSRAGAMPG